MNETVKEVLQIVVFLVVVGSLVWILVVNPLGNTKNSLGRNDEAVISIDSLPPNDPAAFIEAGFANVDTIRVEADGITSLAVLHVRPELADSASPIGTVIVNHRDRTDRTSQIDLIRTLIDSGYDVFAYDQRSSGLSSGQYTGVGEYEASDLEELIAWLDVRSMIAHPLAVIGFEIGADAAFRASLEESRIDRLVLVDPYLTSDRLLDVKREAGGYMWFPFYRSVMWWWYGIRSGFAAEYVDLEQVQGPVNPTLVLTSEENLQLEEFTRFAELAEGPAPVMSSLPADQDQLNETILRYLGEAENE